MSVGNLSILLLLTLPKCFSIYLDIFIPNSWREKELIVGFRDQLSFILRQGRQTATWKLGDESEIGPSNGFSIEDKIDAIEDFQLKITISDEIPKTITIQVKVKDQREVPVEDYMWGIENEMLTLIQMRSCIKYYFNDKEQDIESEMFKDIQYTSNALRILQVSAKHIGKHTCDRMSFNIVGLKEKVEVEMKDKMTVEVIPELQYLVLKAPTEFQGDWYSEANNELFYLFIAFHQIDDSLKLVMDRVPESFEVVFTTDDFQNLTMRILLKRITPRLEITGDVNLLQGNEITVECTRLDTFKHLIKGKMIILDQGFQVAVSDESTLVKSFTPVSKNGDVLLACISQYQFRGNHYQFEDIQVISILSPISVFTNSTIQGYSGQLFALVFDGVSNHKQINVCYQKNQEQIYYRVTQMNDFYRIIINYPGIRSGYAHLDGVECLEKSAERVNFTHIINPFKPFLYADSIRSIYMVSNADEKLNVKLKFETENWVHVSLFLDHSGRKISKNIISLFRRDIPGTYGTTQFLVHVKNDIYSLERKKHEFYLNSIFVHPYINIGSSASPIDIYVGEYVAFCPFPILIYDQCEIEGGTDLWEEPFDQQRFRYHGGCLLFEARYREAFKWVCHTNIIVDQSSYKWNINVVEFPITPKFSTRIFADTVIINCDLIEQSETKVVEEIGIYPTHSINYFLLSEISNEYLVNTPMRFVEEMTCRIKFVDATESRKRFIYKKKIALIITKIHQLHIENEPYDLNCFEGTIISESISWINHELSDVLIMTNTQITTVTTPKFSMNAKYSCIWQNETHLGHTVHVLKVEKGNTDISISAEHFDESFPDSDTPCYSNDASYKMLKLRVICTIKFKKRTNLPGTIILTNTNSPLCKSQEMATCAHSKLDFMIGTDTELTSTLEIPVHEKEMKFSCDVETSESTHSQKQVVVIKEDILMVIHPNTHKLQVLTENQLELRCSVIVTQTNLNSYNLVWKNSRNSSLKSTSNRLSILRINSVTESDGGQYTCELQSDKQTRIMSRCISITVNNNNNKIMPRILATVSSRMKTLTHYDTFTVSCYILNPESASSGTLEITNGKSSCAIFRRCAEIIYSRGNDRVSLTISNPDNFHDQKYICRAKISNSDDVEETITLPIAKEPYISITTDKSLETIKENNSIVITCCIISEYPLPRKHIWPHTLIQTPDYSYHEFKNCSYTTISNLNERRDAGKFYCSAIVNGKTIYNYINLIFPNDSTMSRDHDEPLPDIGDKGKMPHTNKDDSKTSPNGIHREISTDQVDKQALQTENVENLKPLVPIKVRDSTSNNIEPALQCNVKNTGDGKMIWVVEGKYTNTGECMKIDQYSVQSTSTYSCSEVINAFGVHEASCVSSSDERILNLRTISFNVLPKPTISSFNYTLKPEESSDDVSDYTIICKATGLVSQLTISILVDGSSRKPLATRTIADTNKDSSSIKSISHSLRKLDVKGQVTLECNATSKILHSFQSPGWTVKSLTIQDSSSNQSLVFLYVAIPILVILMSLCGIAYIWFYGNPIRCAFNKQKA